jgi:uncharacterized membrane protein
VKAVEPAVKDVPVWLIPMVYSAASIVCGFVLPRVEHYYLSGLENTMSADSALVVLSTVASGMISLTAIVFSIAYVTMQFNAVAYSPRLALWFSRDPLPMHAFGMFTATFLYALSTMTWVDRGGSGKAPIISTWIVAILLMVSMIMFARLVRGLMDLQITNTLRQIGDRGRETIRKTFQRLDSLPSAERTGGSEPSSITSPGAPTQTIKYTGVPQVIGDLDIAGLVRLASQADALIEMGCAVGDTVVDDTLLLRVLGGTRVLADADLRRCIHLTSDRTFEQDPKYPLRLLVDIAIKALSPAINDPTTAVQAIDQIEDLLRRLGRRELDAGYARDGNGVLRLIFPMPSWEDYLRLAFDEIRQYGATSVQVMRRLRSALLGIKESAVIEGRAMSVERYLHHLDLIIERSPLDAEDRLVASQEDRQGLGISRRHSDPRRPAVTRDSQDQLTA